MSSTGRAKAQTKGETRRIIILTTGEILPDGRTIEFVPGFAAIMRSLPWFHRIPIKTITNPNRLKAWQAPGFCYFWSIHNVVQPRFIADDCRGCAKGLAPIRRFNRYAQ